MRQIADGFLFHGDCGGGIDVVGDVETDRSADLQNLGGCRKVQGHVPGGCADCLADSFTKCIDAYRGGPANRESGDAFKCDGATGNEGIFLRRRADDHAKVSAGQPETGVSGSDKCGDSGDGYFQAIADLTDGESATECGKAAGAGGDGAFEDRSSIVGGEDHADRSTCGHGDCFIDSTARGVDAGCEAAGNGQSGDTDQSRVPVGIKGIGIAGGGLIKHSTEAGSRDLSSHFVPGSGQIIRVAAEKRADICGSQLDFGCGAGHGLFEAKIAGHGGEAGDGDIDAAAETCVTRGDSHVIGSV